MKIFGTEKIHATPDYSFNDKEASYKQMQERADGESARAELIKKMGGIEKYREDEKRARDIGFDAMLIAAIEKNKTDNSN